MATDGKSLSNGSYSGQICLAATGPGIGGPHVNGAPTGYIVSPVNGTFKGILNSSLHGSAIVTFSITQNPDFTLKVSGTIVESAFQA